jgi:S1-C subfamily serine protease
VLCGFIKAFREIVQASIIASTFYGGLAFITAPVAMAASQNPSTIAATNSHADIVDGVTPAVVTIRSAKRVPAPQQFPFSDDPFLRQFFGNGNRNRQRDEQSLVEHALGSGVIVSTDGYILTNHHVIDGADEISVELTDRRSFAAKVIGSDAPSDLALLKIEALEQRARDKALAGGQTGEASRQGSIQFHRSGVAHHAGRRWDCPGLSRSTASSGFRPSADHCSRAQQRSIE